MVRTGDRERIVVGTDKGEILVIDNGDVRGTLMVDDTCAVQAITVTPKACLCPSCYPSYTSKHRKYRLASHSPSASSTSYLSGVIHKPACMCMRVDFAAQGFAVGLSSGAVTLYERDQDERLFKRAKHLTVEGQIHSVHSMALSLAEDTILVSMGNNQLYSLNLTTNEQAV